MSIQFSNGTIFADAACKKPVATSMSSTATATISIPAGARHIAFGFVPAEPGSGFIEVMGQLLGGPVSFEVE
jgi:hypothetical protein